MEKCSLILGVSASPAGAAGRSLLITATEDVLDAA